MRRWRHGKLFAAPCTLQGTWPGAHAHHAAVRACTGAPIQIPNSQHPTHPPTHPPRRARCLQVLRDMSRNKWMTPKEAVEYGMIDHVLTGPRAKKPEGGSKVPGFKFTREGEDIF